MPIVIQELISSDTISQAVDKINFNFDQLILNGGGPVGPAGPPGPTGPVGGRGIQGATWYKDNTPRPGVNPNSLIIAGLKEDDYYLQSDGQVWQYNGTVWIQTIINLTGPQGPTGLSFGFNYAGGFPGAASINNQNIAYPVPMPGGVSSGANALTNQGVSTLLVGAVASNAIPPSGVSAFTSAFQIPDQMTRSLDSSILSALIHQKDSSSSAIRFMGGGDNISDKYEQLILGNLSNITLGVDDSFNINVPKAATLPISLSDLIGFNLNTVRKGQQFYSGKHINFISGADLSPSGFSGEISDISYIINTANPLTPAKLSIATTFAAATALFEVGGNITIPTTTIRTGRILGEAASIGLISPDIILRASSSNSITVRPISIDINAGTGPINIQTTNSQNISIAANDILSMSGLNLVTIVSQAVNVGASVIGLGFDGIGGQHGISVENPSPTTGGIKMRGNVTWHPTTQSGTTFINSHRNISIGKGNLTGNQPAIIIGNTVFTTGAGQRDLMLAAFRGTSFNTAVEAIRVFSASTEIINSGNTAGFVGHIVNNATASMPAEDIGYRLRGIDRSGGNTAILTKFHAKEDTTSVHNRMQYVKRSVFINPIFEGINLAGAGAANGFNIPATAMDATYLDILIGGSSFVPLSDQGLSDDDIFINVPEGSYQGQRLVIHIIAANAIYNDGISVNRSWPSVAGSVSIACRMGGAQNGFPLVKVAQLDIPAAGFGVFGAEATIELLWVGQVYVVSDTTPLGTQSLRRSSGWILTNGVGIVNATVGTYQAVQNFQSWQLIP